MAAISEEEILTSRDVRTVVDRNNPDVKRLLTAVAALKSSKVRLLFAAAFIFVFAFAAYLPILPGSFLMDDWRLIQTDNPLANGQLTPFSIWFQTGFPLSDLGLWLEGNAWGENPLFYHLVNVTLHAASAVLVWRVLVWLQVRGAWLAALLFAIHPICVNSVARIAELKNTLSLPFFLASLLCYFRYEAIALHPKRPSSARARRVGTIFYSLSIIAFVLALFAKTSTVMLPAILCACAIWRRGRLSTKDFCHIAPHFLLAVSFGLMSIWFQKYQALAGQMLPPSSQVERILIAPRVFLFYLGKALLPLNLSIVYPRWNVETHSLDALLPLALMCICALVCWRFQRSWGRHAFFGLSCFVILLFPVLGLFDAQFLTRWQVSDHLEYLPLIAPITLAAAAFASIPEALRAIQNNFRAAGEALLGLTRQNVTRLGSSAIHAGNSKSYWFFAAGFVAVLFALTFHRANAFSTGEKLMRDTLAKNPMASDAHNDLGAIMVRRNNLAEAQDEFSAAIRTDPDNLSAQSNLALVMVLQGHLSEAKSRLRLVLKTKPFDAETHLKLADICRMQGQFRRARYHLRMALCMKPTVGTRLQLAQLCYERHRFREAVAAFRDVVRAKPDSTEALNNLAWLLATCGDSSVRNGSEAVRYAKQACCLTDFKQSLFISTLAAAYAEAGRFPQAIGTAKRALRLQTIAGETQFAALNRQLLEQYLAGKAFHDQVIPTEDED